MRTRTIVANAEQLKAKYPISGLVSGWFFKQEEFSPGGWRVTGSDLFGRIVSREGTDPQTLLQACARDAEAIEAQVKSAET